ncbi:SxtJ family membrane protein [Pelagicoccus sp. SDUM812002]|uniref:SxtJ family membrane protein n=1 Tax=Pelagicoccus sp. SDUM812002 TaxID=3041266 RepID=UPI00280EB328|nr:SxtJ family membrane protein [Pelagicoccus sp. SDUM812002]MDQ8185790.1 SxtJ family membrane protein [Pelagicoccus sp. SDUM812002]
MSLIRVERNPKSKDLRVFSLLWLLFFTGVAFFSYLNEREVISVYLIGFAVLVGGIGLAKPSLVRYVYLGSVYLTFPIGFVISHIVLAILYFLMLSPIGLLMRAFGRDPLNRSFEAERCSYWDAKGEEASSSKYFKQY